MNDDILKRGNQLKREIEELTRILNGAYTTAELASYLSEVDSEQFKALVREKVSDRRAALQAEFDAL